MLCLGPNSDLLEGIPSLLYSLAWVRCPSLSSHHTLYFFHHGPDVKYTYLLLVHTPPVPELLEGKA